MLRNLIAGVALIAANGSCSDRPGNAVGHGGSDAGARIFLAQDAERLYVSIVNVSNFNFRWDSYPRAEQTGDVRFTITRNGLNFPSMLLSSEVSSSDGLIWIQSGDGVAFSRRKSLLLERFKLEPGCYDISVHVTNRAAVKAHGMAAGNPGPVIEAISEVMEVCF